MPRTNSNHSTAALRVMATVVPCNLEDYMTQKKSGRHQAVPLVYARVSGPPLADPAVKIRLGQISHGVCSYSQAIISDTVARGELSYMLRSDRTAISPPRPHPARPRTYRTFLDNLSTLLTASILGLQKCVQKVAVFEEPSHHFKIDLIRS